MDLRVGTRDTEGTPWSVLSDLAITMVLVLVVFIVLLFVQTFRERMINAELVRQQREVRDSLHADPIRKMAVTIDSLAPDRQKLTFASELLFRTCEDSLKPGGDSLLHSVVGVLGARQQYFETVAIEGHTDIRRIGRNCPFPSNWELSSARATRVVTLFAATGAIELRKLSAVGRAEFHPADTNIDKNRRIEIVLRYDRQRVLPGAASNASMAAVLPRPARARAITRDTASTPTFDAVREMEPTVARESVRALPADPRIVLSREVYRDVERRMAAQAHEITECGGVRMRLGRDSTGVARKLTRELRDGTSGSAYYYDANGILRFSFHWYNSVQSRHESRVYFDIVGAQFHREDRTMSGQPYKGGYEVAIRDPEERFVSCGAP